MSPWESPAPDGALALEKHEPLRPVAVGVLVAEDPHENVADRLRATEGEQQFHRPLGHVAGAPATAGILFQTTRGEVVDERVMDEPGQDLGQSLDLPGKGAFGGGRQPKPRGHGAPVVVGR